MNQPNFKNLSLELAGAGRWLIFFVVLWLLGSIGLGWLIQSVVFLIGLLLLVPAILFGGLQWWVRRQIVQDTCPVCSYEFMAMAQAELSCPNCGETLQVKDRRFVRQAPPGTIDVQAVEVSTSPADDEPRQSI